MFPCHSLRNTKNVANNSKSWHAKSHTNSHANSHTVFLKGVSNQFSHPQFSHGGLAPILTPNLTTNSHTNSHDQFSHRFSHRFSHQFAHQFSHQNLMCQGTGIPRPQVTAPSSAPLDGTPRQRFRKKMFFGTPSCASIKSAELGLGPGRFAWLARPPFPGKSHS